MTQITRPGTPFPHTTSLSHSTSTSPLSYHSPKPLHFALPSLPSRTPPSLLKRNPSSYTSTHSASSSSSSSSSSTTTTTRTEMREPNTPELLGRRESSSSSYSTASSYAGPSTPRSSFAHPEAEIYSPSSSDDDEMDMEHDIPSATLPPTPASTPAFGSSSIAAGKLALPEPSYNWLPKSTPIETPIFTLPNIPIESITQRPIQPTPKRPKLKRRDTPRPEAATTLGRLRMEEIGLGRGKRLTSVIDGGNWVVVA